MSFEANKIAGAILAAMLLAMLSGMIANILVHPTPLSKPVYSLGGAPTAESPEASAAPAGPEPIGPLMAAANIQAGAAKTALCKSCHTFDKGGPNRIGPNLYGVVGSPIAEGRGGFSFSSALQAKGKGQTWTLDNLNAWLFKPQAFARGTKMTFIGLPKAQDRANVIAYLNSMSDKPEPIAQLTQGAAGMNPPAGGAKAGATPASAPAKSGPTGAHANGAPNAANPAAANATTGSNAAAPKTPGPGQGANTHSSAIEGEAKQSANPKP